MIQSYLVNLQKLLGTWPSPRRPPSNVAPAVPGAATIVGTMERIKNILPNSNRLKFIIHQIERVDEYATKNI